jgi:hypothetical protein
MSITVSTPANLRITTGMLLTGQPTNNFPQGTPAIALPTVPVPPTVATLTMGQWIMDPSGEYVLMLSQQGLVLYQVIGNGNPTTGQFQGLAVWGPSGGDNSFVFCAQADGNAVVYDSNFPNQLNPQWHANQGPSNAQYLLVLESGSWAVVQLSPVTQS